MVVCLNVHLFQIADMVLPAWVEKSVHEINMHEPFCCGILALSRFLFQFQDYSGNMDIPVRSRREALEGTFP